MGQRHQVFLIARVGSDTHGEAPYYRCIAAFHHQWCYGRLPLKATRRFLTLVKQKDNAQIIREELRNFEKATSDDVPCPYSLFLLASAWTVDLTPGKEYNSGGCVLSADMGSSEGDNNDGITVIDVTDPENASYCFVSVNGLEVSDDDIPCFIPVNAKQYVRSYYPEPDDKKNDSMEEDVLETIASLDDVPLVTIDKLADAWPREYHRTTTTPPAPVQKEVVPQMPCLADLSVEPAINHALEVGQIDTLELLFDMPGKAALIKDALQKRISLPDDAIALVTKILSPEVQKSKELDLSQWALASEQVVKVVSQQKNIESLGLSHNHHVTKTTVLGVLSAQPTLRRLVLLDTAVTNADMDELLSENPKLFYSLEAIIHPSFLCARKTHGGAFAHITSEGNDHNAVYLPYFTPGQVVQALTDLLGLTDQPYSHLPDGYAVQAAYASELRKDGCPWVERIVPIYPESSRPALSDGWTVVWMLPGYRDPDIKRYGFVRPCEGNDLGSGEIYEGDVEGSAAAGPSSTYDIHDLKSFIQALVSEGRPAPSPAALEKLSENLSANFTLLTQQDLDTLSKKWKEIRVLADGIKR